MERKRRSDDNGDGEKRFGIEEYVHGFQMSDLDGEMVPKDHNAVEAQFAETSAMIAVSILLTWC